MFTQGVSAHSEELLASPNLLQLARDRGLVVFSWGKDYDNDDALARIHDLGIDAIIYDRCVRGKIQINNVIYRVKNKYHVKMPAGLHIAIC